MKPYPEYQDSGVPWLKNVPKEWRIRRLKNIAKMLVSSVDKHVIDGELPVRLCNYVDVYKNNEITDRIHFMKATATKNEIRQFKLLLNDVLITKDSETWNDIGIPSLNKYEAEDFICGYHLAILRPRMNLTSRYLHKLLQARTISYQFHVAANGVTRFGLSHQSIKAIELPLPSLIEQVQIARFLDWKTAQIAKFIKAKKRMIELLKEQKQIIINDAVTGKIDVATGKPYPKYKNSGVEWLGQVPKEWSLRRNINLFWERNESGIEGLPSLVVSINTGVTLGDNLDESGRPKRFIEDKGKYKLAIENDISYNMMRMWQGAVGKIPVKGLVSPAYVVAVPLPGVDPDYYVFLFRINQYLNEINRNSRGIVTDRNRLYWDDFKNIVSPYPPKQTQSSIVKYIYVKISSINFTISRIEREVAFILEYRDRLIADVVTGKIDVREIDVPEVKEEELLTEIDSEDVESDEIPDDEEVQNADD